jgi:hypothetical protein
MTWDKISMRQVFKISKQSKGNLTIQDWMGGLVGLAETILKGTPRTIPLKFILVWHSGFRLRM